MSLYTSDICASDLAVPISGVTSYSVSNPHVVDTFHGRISYGCDKGARDVNMDVVLVEPSHAGVGVIDGMGGYGIESSMALPIITKYLQQALQRQVDINLAHRLAEDELTDLNNKGGAVYLLLRFQGNTYDCISAGDAGMVHHNPGGELLFKSLPHSFGRGPFNYIRGTPNNNPNAHREPIFNLGTGSGRKLDPSKSDSPRLYDIGDRFILASDGLWGAMKQEEVVELTKTLPLEDAVKLLGKEAKKRMDDGKANKDNLSIICYETTPS